MLPASRHGGLIPSRSVSRSNLPAMLLALAAALFCGASALGVTTRLCATAGCSLFKGMTILGVDLYWIGAGGFALLAAMLALRSRSQLAELAVDVGLAVALLFDAVLLLVLAVSMPCVNCLTVATLLGLAALCAWPAGSLGRWLLAGWFVCYVTVLPGLARESLGPVAMVGNPQGAIQVFFSPTCPACREAVEALLARHDLDGQVAYCPIAKNDEDFGRLQSLRAALDAGQSLDWALGAVLAPGGLPRAQLSWGQRLALRFMSQRNMLAVLRTGARTVPLLLASAPGLGQLVVAGRPQSILDQLQLDNPATPSAPPAGPGKGLDLLHSSPQGCGFEEEKPCAPQ